MFLSPCSRIKHHVTTHKSNKISDGIFSIHYVVVFPLLLRPASSSHLHHQKWRDDPLPFSLLNATPSTLSPPPRPPRRTVSPRFRNHPQSFINNSQCQSPSFTPRPALLFLQYKTRRFYLRVDDCSGRRQPRALQARPCPHEKPPFLLGPIHNLRV